MRVKIIPHGALRDTWPTGFECEAETAHEAIRAMESQHDLKGQHTVRLVGYDTQPSLYCPLRGPELHVVPEFSGGGGFLKIVIGVVIVVATIVLLAYGQAWAVSGIGIGVSLIFGGILELLTPAPKITPGAVNVESRYLGNVKNTVKVGTTCPIGYGRYPNYGHYVSFGVASNPSAEVASAKAKRQAQGLAA